MLLKLAWRNLWRNKLRTTIMLCSLIIGLLGVVLCIGFMSGMAESMVVNAIRWQTSHIQIHHPLYHQDPDLSNLIPDSAGVRQVLENDENVQTWSARQIAHGMIASARANRGMRINGIDILRELDIMPLHQQIIQGQWFDSDGRNPILVSEKTADRLKLRLGSKVVVTLSDVNGDVTGAAFKVRGIFRTPNSGFDERNVYVRKDDLRQLTGVEGDHEFAILVAGRDSASRVKDILSLQLNSDTEPSFYLVEDWQTLQPFMKTIVTSMDAMNAVFLAVFVSALGFGIVNIMLMAVFERTREYGVLMAVGMPPDAVRKLIVFESAWLGLIGALGGVVSGAIAMSLLQSSGLDLSMFAEGLASFGLDTVLYPRVENTQYLLIMLTVLVVSVISALYPARQIINKSPVRAMAEKH